MSTVSRAPRRYFVEFNVAMVLYAAAVLGRGHLVPLVDSPVLKTMIIVSPILPVLLAAFAVVRFYRGMDEYHRLRILESLAIAAGVTAVVAVSWGFLEDAGFPRLPLSTALPIIMGVWAAVSIYFGWRDKLSEGAAWSVVRSVTPTLVYVALGTALYALIALLFGLGARWPDLLVVATVLFLARLGFHIFTSKSC